MNRPPSGHGRSGRWRVEACQAAAGSNVAAIDKMRPVLPSSVSVLALGMVVRFCSTSKPVGLFSLITVSVPSACELKTSIVAELKTAPSVTPASGRVVMMLPSSALENHHYVWLAAGCKKNAIFCVDG